MMNKIYGVLLIGVIGAVIYAVYTQKKTEAEFQDELSEVIESGNIGIAYESAVKVEVGISTSNRRYEKFNPGDEVTHNGAVAEFSNAIVIIKVFPEEKDQAPFETEWYYENRPVSEINEIAEKAESGNVQLLPIKYKPSKTENGKFTVAPLDDAQFQKYQKQFNELEKRAREDTRFLPDENS